MTNIFIPAPEILDSPRGRHLAGAAPDALRLGGAPLPRATSLVIIGGGLAAITLAAQLWHNGFADYILLEREARLAGRFFDRVDAVGQHVMRSPYEHHPGAEGHRDCELIEFARLNWSQLTPVEQHEVRMSQSGQRGVPPVDVFEGYCSHVVASHDVARHACQATALEVRRDPQGWLVQTNLGDIRARCVVLAIGERRRSAPLGWDCDSDRVRYWDEKRAAGEGSQVVIGAGLSAAHVVHNLCRRGYEVTWIFRGQEHYKCADVNAAFFRPEGRAIFGAGTLESRAQLLHAERRRSIMFEFRPRLRAWEESGQLTVSRETDVTALRAHRTHVALDTDRLGTVTADYVHLALGTEPVIPFGLGGSVRQHEGLLVADAETMQVDQAPGLLVTGALASLALGPAARNVDGHRVAAARIVRALSGGLPAT